MNITKMSFLGGAEGLVCSNRIQPDSSESRPLTLPPAWEITPNGKIRNTGKSRAEMGNGNGFSGCSTLGIHGYPSSDQCASGGPGILAS